MNTRETCLPGTALMTALRALPDVGDMPPDDIVAELARSFRKRLTIDERRILATAAMLSLDPDSRDALIREAERGRRADEVFRGAGRHG